MCEIGLIEHTQLGLHTTRLVSAAQDDLGNYSDDLLHFLELEDSQATNNKLTLFDDLPNGQNSNSSSDCSELTANQKLQNRAVSDHDYSRKSTSASDSGILSDNPISPQFSDTTDSAFSPAATSACSGDDKSTENEATLQTLDPACLLNSDDLLSKLADDSNFTLDLDGEIGLFLL